MDTPLYKFRPEDHDVYEPAEDSFLLLDALEEELPAIKLLSPALCVEIGPGSGIIITALAKALGSAGWFLGVDINPHACGMTKRTGEMNGCSRVDVVNGSLLGGLRDGAVDLLVFNPPYVPTAEEDGAELEEQIDQFRREGRELVKSWAGGRDGMVVTEKVLADLERVLSPRGVFYILLVKENKPEEVIRRLGKEGFKGRIVKDRKIRGEHLFVLKISRNKS